MTYRLAVLAMCAAVAGCGALDLEPAAPGASSEGQARPQSRPDAVQNAASRPPTTARTVEEFDTTTAEERQAAATPAAAAGGALLGSTIVSLGDPARPGFWIETPLASAAGTGRVIYPGTGQSAQVELIPIDGPATAGSRMSLAAMRLIGVPLAGLAEVQVFSGG